jgi:hypothetical protein
VVSRDTEAFLKRKSDIENAVRSALIQCGQSQFMPVFDEHAANMQSDSPTIEESTRVIAALIGSAPNPCVNYTGGTKEMSIGAWCAAKDAQVPSIYCDSPREFRSGGTGDIEFSTQLPEIATKLELPTILAAQGFLEGKHWKRAKTTGARIQFGQVAFELGQRQPQLMRGLRATIRDHGIKSGGRKPNIEDMRRAANEPLPIQEDELTRPFLEAAERTSLLKRKGRQWYFQIPQQGNARERAQRLQFVITNLDGGAFEGYVHHCLEMSDRFSRFIHGVMPASTSEDAEFGETDFLAFEPQTAGLTLISCKSSPPSLEHLESVLSRKNTLGGRFAKAMLCIEQTVPKRQGELRKQAASLGIECVFGSEIDSKICSQEKAANLAPLDAIKHSLPMKAETKNYPAFQPPNLADAFK